MMTKRLEKLLCGRGDSDEIFDEAVTKCNLTKKESKRLTILASTRIIYYLNKLYKEVEKLKKNKYKKEELI